MRKPNTIVTGAVAITAAAAVAITGASLSAARSTGETASAASSAGDGGMAGVALVGQAATGSTGSSTGSSAGSANSSAATDGWGRHRHTTVTGDALARVTAAVKAKDAGITVRRVLQDSDGSYDVMGTKADGTRVKVEVSKDLKTVEVRTGGPRMGPPGGRRDGLGAGAMSGTAVTADTLQKIAAAVKAKDATVTVRAALKLTDGTYWAVGTKADGTRVMASLNAQLAVTTLQTRSARGPDGGMGRHGMRGDGSTPPTPGSRTATSTAAAV